MDSPLLNSDYNSYTNNDSVAEPSHCKYRGFYSKSDRIGGLSFMIRSLLPSFPPSLLPSGFPTTSVGVVSNYLSEQL